MDILVVDDTPDLCQVIETILKFEGYDVQACTNPLLINEIISKDKPRLVITDMLMSGMDGTEVCKTLKAKPETEDIKVLMISAHPEAETLCMKAGANDFLSKPFDIQVLIDKVKQVLN